MKKIAKIVFFFCWFVYSSTCLAVGPVTSPSDLSECADFVKAMQSRDSRDELRTHFWVVWYWGLVTGFNATSPGPNSVVVENAESVKLYLDKFCRDNPLEKTAMGAFGLLGERLPKGKKR